MHVDALYRYPVKSLVGEALQRLDVAPHGVAGDRVWYVRTEDGFIGSGKATRRFRRVDRLLALSATTTGDGPLVSFPGGVAHPVGSPEADVALAAHTGRAVRFARESDVRVLDEGPVHLLTTSSLRRLADVVGDEVDARRFRANVVVASPEHGGFPENDWRTVRLGSDVVLRVEGPMPRCVMVTMPTRELDADPRVLRAVHAAAGGDLGVWATVVRPGRVHVGDEVVAAP